MTPRLRQLALTAHVTVSVGWLGAVAAFLALNVAALESQDVEVARGAYLAMDLIGRFVIVPSSLGSIATGLLLALSTEWGLFRHYWVAVKFALTTLATIALALHQFTAVAAAAKVVSGSASGTPLSSDLRRIGIQLVADASLAVVVLLATTALSIFKPWGRTAHGRRARGGDENLEPSSASGSGLKIAVIVFGLLVLAFVVFHLAGGGLHHGR